MNPIKRLLISITVLFFILMLGTIGFVIIEKQGGWTFLDSFYFTLITLTTIGYTEVHPLSDDGRIFTVFLIFFGVGTTAYIISTSAQIILDGQLQEFLRSTKMLKAISKLNHHYIICGYGRIGKFVADELHKQKYPFVVVESQDAKIDELANKKFLFIKGNAANDDTLINSGIKFAKALVIVVGHDADSVFITLTGRGLRDDIYILARYEEAGTKQKLLTAGANRILSPHLIGGWRMVQLLLQPNVRDFLDLATSPEMLEFAFEEVKIGRGCSLVNKTLKESGLRQQYDVIVIGVKDKSGNVAFNPASEVRLCEDDILIIIGPLDQINKLNHLSGIIRL